ncbi:RE1-silencing transcription factor-like [Cydia pomonella]|uniref:RE1-silencing transcription factor-like n=1 Tax=Cydia pomonella TaxID=82600 RepID=UPI002ADE65C7|nr:RE1-silencing transcription factor-like [Cydia pomonella]
MDPFCTGLNPPSEFLCMVDRCYGHTQHTDSSDSDVIADEDTRSNVEPTGRRRRIECKLCEKTFASLYRLWQHYEREHVDICRKTCCNGTALKNGNTNRLLKAPRPPECAGRGAASRSNTQMKLHLATLRHKLRSLWRYQCDICKRKFEDKKGIAEHIEREHLAKEANKCPICAATFRSERALRTHAAAHEHAHANSHAHTHARTQAHGTRKPRTRKRTDTETIKDTENTATDALNNGRVKRKRKRTRWTRRRKQLARNSDTQSVQCTRKRTQGTQSRKQLATNSDTHTNGQETPKQTQRTQSRKQLALNSDTHRNVQRIRRYTQDTQSRTQLARNTDTHTNGVQHTQTQETRKRTQTVGELRKMHLSKERTQVENERVVNYYLDRFTLFEAGGGISRALIDPPTVHGSQSQL